jgi:hypothetical protein
MADYTEIFPLGAGDFNSTVATAAAVGGVLAAVNGSGTVGPAGAGSLLIVGVFGHDAAVGAKVTIKPLKKVHETVAGTGGLTAGNPLKADANGLVTLWVTGTDSAAAFVGIALTTASAAALVRWIGR